MFCPNCGNAEQKENSYCRKCGGFLPDLKKIGASSFGGNTPQENVRSINNLSLIASVFSLFIAVLMYATNHSVPWILHLAAAVLLCNAFWHLSNYYIGRKLAAKINLKQESEQPQILPENKPDFSQNILPEAQPQQFIEPNSVTENTTRKLKVNSGE